MDTKEMEGQALALIEQARAVYTNEQATAEEIQAAEKMLADARQLKTRASKLGELERAAAEFAPAENKTARGGGCWATLGHFLVDLYNFKSPYIMPDQKNPFIQGLRYEAKDEPVTPTTWYAPVGQVSKEAKDLVESVGAAGGFLVPPEFRPELLRVDYEKNVVRPRATVIPMTRRQIVVPTLDQTGAAAGQTQMFGGITASWVEEATYKPETEPHFRQIDLVAHELVCYTEVSDALLEDSAVSLSALLTGPMGFGGAIQWQEEYCFLQGTGAGQPLGVVGANGTFVQPRFAAGTISLQDIFNMLAHHIGDNPIWHINRAARALVMGLAGPAGNPSYVWINNMREGLPVNLMGIPIHWTEKLPAVGVRGDIVLADWAYYYVGDRKNTVIDSSKDYRYRYNLTAWRAVHRVDGQPMLSQPITCADGTFQISPFVVLGAEAS